MNNAGLGTNHDALDATEAEWDELFAVNVRGLFFACQSAARRMVEQRHGRIVNIASQAGLVGIPRHAAYSASKGAVIALTKVVALEWAPFGVTVNSVAPTFIRTPGTAERLDRPEFLTDVLEHARRTRRHHDRRGRRRDLPRIARGEPRHGDRPGRRRRLDGAVATGQAPGAGMSSPTKTEPFQYASSRWVPRRQPFRSRWSSCGGSCRPKS